MCAEPNLSCEQNENDSHERAAVDVALSSSPRSASLASIPATSGNSLESLTEPRRIAPTPHPPPLPPTPSISSLSSLPPTVPLCIRAPIPALSETPPTNICVRGRKIASYLNPFASEFMPAQNAARLLLSQLTATTRSSSALKKDNAPPPPPIERPTPAYCKLYDFECMSMAERLESALQHASVLERREGIITGFANKCRVYPIEPWGMSISMPFTKPFAQKHSSKCKVKNDEPDCDSSKEGTNGQVTPKNSPDRSFLQHCNGDQLSTMTFSSSSSITRSLLTSSSKPFMSSESQSLHSSPSVLPNGNIREKEIKVIYQRVCEGAATKTAQQSNVCLGSGGEQHNQSSHYQSSKCSATGMMTTKIQNLNAEEIDLASLLTTNLLQSCASSKKKKPDDFIRPANCSFCGRSMETAAHADGLTHMLQQSLEESNSEYRIIFDTVSIDRDNNRKVVQNMMATATTSSYPTTTIICKELKGDEIFSETDAINAANGNRKQVHNIRINKVLGGCAATLGEGGSVACSACCTQFNELYINRPFGGTTQINMPATMNMKSSMPVVDVELSKPQSLPTQQQRKSKDKENRYSTYSHSQQHQHHVEVIRNCVLQQTTSKTEIHINPHSGHRHHRFTETKTGPTEAALVSFKNLPSHVLHKLSNIVITILHDNKDILEDDLTSMYPNSKSTIDSSATQTTASSSQGVHVRARPRENTASLLRRRNIQKYLERNQQKLKEQTKRVYMHFRRSKKRAPETAASTESNA